jgi:GH25 family lysozyme M1 (1,4-beta-N-acetylmuramidase)
MTLVKAVEQRIGPGMGAAKNEAVRADLASAGVEITPQVEAQIEAAVLDLPSKAEVSAPFSELAVQKTELEGIDVSKHNDTIDYKFVKSFVINSATCNGKDLMFETNCGSAKEAGLHVGAYFYSYATTVETVHKDAAFFVNLLKGKLFDMPVYMDYEYEPNILALSNRQRTDIMKAFLSDLEAAGFYAGSDFVNNCLIYQELERYDIWAADYRGYCGCKLPFGVWQYLGDKGTCLGVATPCDRDIAYKNYPDIIENAGLNGFM